MRERRQIRNSAHVGRKVDSRNQIELKKAIQSLMILILAASTGACSSAYPGPSDPPADQTVVSTLVQTAQSAETTNTFQNSLAYGYTYHRPDGNRLVAGRGSLPDNVPFEVQLGFVPTWVVAAPAAIGSIWVATSAGGDAAALLIGDDGVAELPIDTGGYNAGQPPLLEVGPDGVSLVSTPSNSGPRLTHPVVLQNGDARVWIDDAGRLHLQEGDHDRTLDVQVLPDARIVQDERDRLLVLSDPTEAYDHGVLVDSVEAGGVILVETGPEFRVAEHFYSPQGLVFEGIMPIWVDLNGDGEREIILTASDQRGGARLLVFSERGDLIAESDPIGQGYRWRHQIAVASPMASGEPEIISVRTPHIGGTLEYFQLRGNDLEIVATIDGVTSHVINTRNLDLALVGDFDSDGSNEVLLPDHARRELLAVSRSDDGAVIDWALHLPDMISSNLAAVTDEDGRITLGVGLENETLWIWSDLLDPK